MFPSKARRRRAALWRRVKSCFGYRLRADIRYEISVAFLVAQTSKAEIRELDADKRFEEASALAERCTEFRANTGAAMPESVRCTRWRQENPTTTRTNPITLRR